MSRLIKEANILKIFSSDGSMGGPTCERPNLTAKAEIMLPALGRFGYFRDCAQGSPPAPTSHKIITFDDDEMVTFNDDNMVHF